MARPQKARAPKEFNMRRALRSKIGRVCHFTHPETGEIVDGIFQSGRKVVRTIGMRRLKPEELTDGAVSGFHLDEQTFTVPVNIKITFGAIPHATPTKAGL